MLEKKNDALIAAKAVLARYGGICGMTLHRWVRDPDLNFPKRLLINGRRYWRLSELLALASGAQMPSILIHAGEITLHPMDVEAMPGASLRPTCAKHVPIPADRSRRSRTASHELWAARP